MRLFAIILYLFTSLVAFSQNEQLAQHYFEKGEFEKSVVAFEELLKSNPNNPFYFQRLVESRQQLQQYDKAQKLIEDRLAQRKEGHLLAELGYNYQLLKNPAKAKSYYDQAIDRIRQNPQEVYQTAAVFEKRVLVEYALQAYRTAREVEPKMNFNYQMAMLYGQAGNPEMMINTFLDEAYTNPHSVIMIQNQLSRFMNEDAEESFNDMLRKALLVRAQKNQDLFWNEFLSWYFVQQKEYGKAFIQEKAIYKRNPETFSNIVNLAQLALEEGDQDAAREIFQFVLENTTDLELLVEAHYHLADMRIRAAKPSDFGQIQTDIDKLLAEFGMTPYTLRLQLLQSQLSTFSLNDPERGKAILKSTLEMQLSRQQQAQVKMALADVFLFEVKFNQALLYYSQIEEDMKNDVIGHEASLKAARTSYFKADFDWALQQFRALKSASTQLIANDALEYFLLINDNSVADSTRTALTKFARADYLLYRNKTSEALSAFQKILAEHQGDEIEGATLLRIGRIYEKTGQYHEALARYSEIIDKHADGIYVDEALFYSASVQQKNLNNPEAAKALYEKIIFGHQDSIYFTESRRQFRTLRGDSTL